MEDCVQCTGIVIWAGCEVVNCEKLTGGGVSLKVDHTTTRLHNDRSVWTTMGATSRWGGLKFATFDKKRTITRKRYKIDACRIVSVKV